MIRRLRAWRAARRRAATLLTQPPHQPGRGTDPSGPGMCQHPPRRNQPPA